MKRVLVLLATGLLLAGNVFANAEWAEMLALEEEESAEQAKIKENEKKLDLKITTSEFFSGKIDGKSVSFPGTNLKEADGNPWMIECHKSQKNPVITMTFKNLPDFSSILSVYNGYIKGSCFEKYGCVSIVEISCEETGARDWYFFEDTAKKQNIFIGNLLPAPGTTETITLKIEVVQDAVLNNYACIDSVSISLCHPDYFDSQGKDKKASLQFTGDYLTEKLKSGTVEYKTSNLYFNDGKPWVADSSKNKNGIGAVLNIRAYYYDKDYYQKLVIYNGFQKDDYYEKNSRLKKVKISYKDKSEVFDIKDTKEAQTLDLTKLLKDCKDEMIDIKLEVLEVYEGYKYSDLCVDAIQVPNVK